MSFPLAGETLGQEYSAEEEERLSPLLKQKLLRQICPWVGFNLQDQAEQVVGGS